LRIIINYKCIKHNIRTVQVPRFALICVPGKYDSRAPYKRIILYLHYNILNTYYVFTHSHKMAEGCMLMRAYTNIHTHLYIIVNNILYYILNICVCMYVFVRARVCVCVCSTHLYQDRYSTNENDFMHDRLRQKKVDKGYQSPLEPWLVQVRSWTQWVFFFTEDNPSRKIIFGRIHGVWNGTTYRSFYVAQIHVFYYIRTSEWVPYFYS